MPADPGAIIIGSDEQKCGVAGETVCQALVNPDEEIITTLQTEVSTDNSTQVAGLAPTYGATAEWVAFCGSVYGISPDYSPQGRLLAQEAQCSLTPAGVLCKDRVDEKKPKGGWPSGNTGVGNSGTTGNTGVGNSGTTGNTGVGNSGTTGMGNSGSQAGYAYTATVPAITGTPSKADSWPGCHGQLTASSNISCSLENNVFYEYWNAANSTESGSELQVTVNAWADATERYYRTFCEGNDETISCSVRGTTEGNSTVSFPVSAVTEYTAADALAYANSHYVGPNG